MVRAEVQDERRLSSEVKDVGDSWARIRGVTLDVTLYKLVSISSQDLPA